MKTTISHPFLDTRLPIRWAELTPEAARLEIPLALAAAKKAIDAIAEVPINEATYINTFASLDAAQAILGRPWGRLDHLKAVADSPELRNVYGEFLPQITAFSTDLFLNQPLYAVLKAAKANTPPEVLSPIETRFMQESLEDFRENGADLPEAKRTRLKAIQEELATLTQAFTEHVMDATNTWELIITNEKDLAGLPSSAIDAARQSAAEKGQSTAEKPAWRFTLQGPSQSAVLTYLDNVEIRKQIWEATQAVGRVAPYDNWPLIQSILKLRTELAQLLGKNHFPDHVLSRRMAKTGAAALQFIEGLQTRIKKAFDHEWETLNAFRSKKLGLPTTERMEPWDTGYWAEKLRKEQYDFDEEALRPYFPEDQVIQGMFELSSRIYGIKITQLPTQPAEAWAEDIQYYRMDDALLGHNLGYFYADWHPRESKRDGAWMSGLSTGEPLAKENPEPHVGTINGNFTPAIGNHPALLTHREVATAFHEFGHLLHHLLSEVPVRSLSGTCVAWDFVEFPSQIMENWCWERESLDLIARHVETNSPLPEALFQKMRSARTFMAASWRMRQLMLAKLDLELHLNPEKYASLPPDAIETLLRETLAGYMAPLKNPSPIIAPRFTHLFGSATGYAAGYYSYQWSEVLEADAFSQFLTVEGSILNPRVGHAFRETVLSQGNSTPPDQIFRNFMGRDPNPEAVLKRDGLL